MVVVLKCLILCPRFGRPPHHTRAAFEAVLTNQVIIFLVTPAIHLFPLRQNFYVDDTNNHLAAKSTVGTLQCINARVDPFLRVDLTSS